MAITNAIVKAGKKAIAKGSEKALANATTKAISKATTDATTKAITKATEKAVNNAITKSITRGLTGAGVSSLAPKAGSTIDGILGRSSGITLPEPKITPKSLSEYTEEVLGEPLDSIGSVMNNMDYTLADIKADKALSRKNYEIVKKNAREAADIMNPVEQMNDLGITSKSGLPMLNREEYYRDTIGSRTLRDGTIDKSWNAKDVPDYMYRHLTNDTAVGNDRILRELFGDHDNVLDMNELYDRYERIAQGANANEIYTPDNIDTGIAMEGERGDAITQDFADRVFGGKRDIPISSSSSGAKNVKVSRPKSTAGVEDAVAGATTTTNPALADDIAEPIAQVSSAGGGMKGGGGTPTATASPDYGGLGDSGFNVKLKNGENIDISLKQPMSKSEIKKSRAVRNLDDSWAKGLNATPTQYKDVVAKSRSAYKGYKTPAEMARLNGISLDNINETPQRVVDAFEQSKLNIEKYAEDRGVNVRLDNLDLSNIEPATKATMKMQGIDPDKIKYTGVASPTEAETLYKDLRNRANKTTDGDRAVAYNTMADYVRKQIDNTLDNLNIDFSYEMSNALGEALGKDADLRYLRGIANNKNLKFSDLRREQADWIKIGNLSGRPIKEGPTINVFGTDTGIPNPLASGAERLKDKFYERQAYGGGGAGGNGGAGEAGGNMGGGSVPPFDGSGAENNINFETVSGRTSNLSNLLNKAKSAGLVGAGVLGGMMLGGGGSGGGSGGSLANMGYNTMANAQSEPEIDPYDSFTIGGYTYDQLESGYTAALMAGDTDAAKLIANMMGMLDDKIERYNTQKKESADSSGIASKQKAALNVLSGLMQNYQSQGPIGGRFTQFMNALTGGGYNPGIAAYDSGAQGSLGTIIKALGDTGALSEGDQRRALELLPKTTDSEEAAKYKYQQLIQILQGAGAQ